MKTAFLYAGQGSQAAGMGRDLYNDFPAFREAFDAPKLSFDLKKVCFEDPDGVINETEYTQPCVTAFSVGVNAVLEENGIVPDYAAGLSLGEYSALSEAGVFDGKTAVELVGYRGKVMADCSKGIDTGMTAVLSLSTDKIQECCDRAGEYGIVQVCNLNCPGQTVIGGERKAVEKASELCMEAGAKRCVSLNVSGPFHTSMMAPAGDKLIEYFKSITFGEMRFPVLFNYLGAEKGDGQTIQELLKLQVQKGVRMEDTIRRLFALGVSTFVEIGPGRTLSGFVKKTAKAMGESGFTIYNIENTEGLKAYLEAAQ